MHTYKIYEKGQSIEKATYAMILLHGRGSTAQDILQLANDLCDDRFYIAAPQAPNHSWYPYSFMAEENSNEPWLTSSVDAVKKLIDEISYHIPKDKIYLIGFSQGACLTLEVSTRFAVKYAGVVAFTGGLIGENINPKKYHGHFEGTPVFIGNSDRDPHVPFIRSEQTKQLMEKMGALVTLKVYKNLGHTINEDEIRWVKENMMPQ